MNKKKCKNELYYSPLYYLTGLKNSATYEKTRNGYPVPDCIGW